MGTLYVGRAVLWVRGGMGSAIDMLCGGYAMRWVCGAMGMGCNGDPVSALVVRSGFIFRLFPCIGTRAHTKLLYRTTLDATLA